ncbi:MAG TPA: hypothetical protein VIA18_33170 [Polyangia bacterium]|nr:hypothetical protein [Polyangia bacterium]
MSTRLRRTGGLCPRAAKLRRAGHRWIRHDRIEAYCGLGLAAPTFAPNIAAYRRTRITPLYSRLTPVSPAEQRVCRRGSGSRWHDFRWSDADALGSTIGFDMRAVCAALAVASEP